MFTWQHTSTVPNKANKKLNLWQNFIVFHVCSLNFSKVIGLSGRPEREHRTGCHRQNCRKDRVQWSGRAATLSTAIRRHMWWEVQRDGGRTRTPPHHASFSILATADVGETKALRNSHLDPQSLYNPKRNIIYGLIIKSLSSHIWRVKVP